MEERLGLARRFQDMQKSLAAICDCAIAIQDLNAQNGAVGDIDAQAAKILALAQEIARERLTAGRETAWPLRAWRKN